VCLCMYISYLYLCIIFAWDMALFASCWHCDNLNNKSHLVYVLDLMDNTQTSPFAACCVNVAQKEGVFGPHINLNLSLIKS